MPTTDVLFAYRCQRCFQQNLASQDQQETNVACTHCENVNSVPLCSETRIQQAEQLMRHADVNASTASVGAQELPSSIGRSENIGKSVNSHRTTTGPLQSIVRTEAAMDQAEALFAGSPSVWESPQSLKEPGAAYVHGQRLAHPGVRLLASLLDGGILLVSFILAIVLTSVCLGIGVVPTMEQCAREGRVPWESSLVFVFIPLLTLIYQWNSITVSGQTIGKMVLGIQIRTLDGRLPGFFQGVILRNWLRQLLSFIPLFGLIDALFIFGESRRCLHDYLAGTRVFSVTKSAGSGNTI